MGLIKAEKAPIGLQAFSMKDIEEAARLIVARAQRQAEQVLADAQRDAETIRHNAHADGFEQGRSEGLTTGIQEGEAAGRAAALDEQRARLTDLIQSLTSIATEFDASRRRLESEALAGVIQLAIAIAERVTKLQGSLESSVLTQNMTAAMKMVVAAADLRIDVNPQQKQTLADALPKLRLEWPNLQHVEIGENETISPGGCRVFTRDGLIDADLEVQLNRIARELLPNRAEGGLPS